MASLLGASTYNVRIGRGVIGNQMKEEHPLISVCDGGGEEACQKMQNFADIIYACPLPSWQRCSEQFAAAA